MDYPRPPMNGQSMLNTLLINIIPRFIILHIEPNKATLASNFLWVAWHLQNAAVSNRKYPEIKKKSAYVLMNFKQKPGITKGHHPTYSSTKQNLLVFKTMII